MDSTFVYTDLGKDKKSTESRGNPVLFAAAALLWLCLLSSWFLSGLSARFTSSSSAGDEARVAKFVVTDQTTMTQNFPVTMKPGDKIPFQVKVTNQSEVAVGYTIKLETEGDLPVKLTKDSSNGADLTETPAGSNIYKAVRPANDSTEGTTYQFNIEWPTEDNSYKSYKYSEGVENVVISVTAAQED